MWKRFDPARPLAVIIGAVVPDPPRKTGIPQGSPAAPRDPREPIKIVPQDSYGGY